MGPTSQGHLRRLWKDKKDTMKLRKYLQHDPHKTEKVPNTWFTGKDTLVRMTPGYLLKNYKTHKNWSKSFWHDKKENKPDKPLKRGYECCRRNENLKRGYCRERSSCHHICHPLHDSRVLDMTPYPCLHGLYPRQSPPMLK